MLLKASMLMMGKKKLARQVKETFVEVVGQEVGECSQCLVSVCEENDNKTI